MAYLNYQDLQNIAAAKAAATAKPPTPAVTPQSDETALLLNQGRQSAQDLSAGAAASTQARSDQAKSFGQNFDQFSQFVNRFLPDGITGSSASSTTSPGGAAGAAAGSGAGTTATPATWTPTPLATPARVASMPTAASTAGPAFAQAKDQVGGSLNGLMKAMGDQFSARNMAGGSAEANSVGNTLAQGNQQLADVARDQAIKTTDVQNADDLAQYNGGITERGQDIGANEAANQASLTGRGQDLTARGQTLSAQEADAARQTAINQSRTAALTGLWSAFNKNSGNGLY